jgi:hypothetical protein
LHIKTNKKATDNLFHKDFPKEDFFFLRKIEREIKGGNQYNFSLKGRYLPFRTTKWNGNNYTKQGVSSSRA